jgi:hypothetical protein
MWRFVARRTTTAARFAGLPKQSYMKESQTLKGIMEARHVACPIEPRCLSPE